MRVLGDVVRGHRVTAVDGVDARTLRQAVLRALHVHRRRVRGRDVLRLLVALADLQCDTGPLERQRSLPLCADFFEHVGDVVVLHGARCEDA